MNIDNTHPNLTQLADQNGQMRILAIDHVNGLRKQLNMLRNNSDVTNDEILMVKSMIIRTLKESVTGILIDPFTYTHSAREMYGACGVLIKLDDGFDSSPWNSKERITKIADVDYAVLKTLGIAGVKLMLYYRHVMSPATKRAQEDIVLQIAKKTAAHGLLLCLEPWWYACKDDETDTLEGKRIIAERRPAMVIEPLREFAKKEYGVGLFKLEVPVDSTFYRFTHRSSEGDATFLYGEDDARKMFVAIDDIVSVPWVIMSSGVTAREFAEYVSLATRAGSSGYICGQAIWQEGVRSFPDAKKMEAVLASTCRDNAAIINAAFTV